MPHTGSTHLETDDLGIFLNCPLSAPQPNINWPVSSIKHQLTRLHEKAIIWPSIMSWNASKDPLTVPKQFLQDKCEINFSFLSQVPFHNSSLGGGHHDPNNFKLRKKLYINKN